MTVLQNKGFVQFNVFRQVRMSLTYIKCKCIQNKELSFINDSIRKQESDNVLVFINGIGVFDPVIPLMISMLHQKWVHTTASDSPNYGPHVYTE